MVNVLLWLAAVEALGLIAFPLAHRLLPHMRDGGFSLSKPLGIMVFGYLLWVLSVLRAAPSAQATAILLLAALGGLSGWYAWRHRDDLRELVRRERATLITSEILFLVVFIGWVVYKSHDPAINHTEQPMDFAFLNASIRSFFGQPEDPWLLGETVSYYYFGYWMMGAVSELTGVVSSVSYNLSLALIPAMSASAIFGLVYSMAGPGPRRTPYAIGAGLAGALLLTAAANLEGLIEFIRANGIGSEGFWGWLGIGGISGPAATITESWRPQEFMWWWRASRVIGSFDGSIQTDYTIHEFPAFSYVLGDLHPHVTSLPFALLFVAALWNLFRTPWAGWRPTDANGLVAPLFLAFLLGGLAFTNMWDLPVFWGLLTGVLALRAFAVHGGYPKQLALGSLPLAFGVLAAALLLYIPYIAGFFTGQVSGISPVGEYAQRSVLVTVSRPAHLLIVWSLPLAAVAPFALAAFWQTRVKPGWARLTLLSLGVAFLPLAVWALLHLGRGGEMSALPGRFMHVLPLGLLVGAAAYGAMWVAKEEPARSGRSFALALAAAGLLLIMGPELLYVDDGFGGANERMNTVFKLYYQAWALLAVAGGFAVYYWTGLWGRVRERKRLWTGVWAGAVLLLACWSLYYTVAAAATKADQGGRAATLDGLAYVADDERRAIEFLRESAPRGGGLVEAVGGDYTEHGRVSASTGIPTVLGWPDHESQWRGSREPFAGREEDVAAIYTTADIDEARALLEKYGASYVVVGPREERKYGNGGLGKFASFMDKVFQEGSVTIYELPD